MTFWNQFDCLLARANHVLLATHIRPDGDALGSQLAMAELLRQRGKSVEIVNPSATPPRYRFLDPDGERIGHLGNGKDPPIRRPDLVIVLDTGTWSQLVGFEKLLPRLEAPIVVIDHHQTQDGIGQLALVDTAASACGQLVYRGFEHLGGALTRDASNALFLAIASDTGWFRHPNTSEEVFEIAARLVDGGAEPARLYRELYENNSVSRLRLLGKMLGNLDLRADGRLAVSRIRLADIRDAAAHPMDTEDFITFPMSIIGVEAAVLFIEQQEGAATKVSFRSRAQMDCSKLAERFGGGGHRAAAGATVAQPMDAAVPAVLAATEAALAAS